MNLRRTMLTMVGLLAVAACSAAAHAQSGVSIEVDQFGVGHTFRPGDLTGVRLKLTSNLAQHTPVWVQWQVPNADGDIAERGRSLTLTPNVPAYTWLYAPLPPDVNSSTVWTVRVFEERDGERRSEVGGNRISPAGAGFVDIGTGLIAVVGQSRMGLEGYANQGGNLRRPASMHEISRVVSISRPTLLPDRWYGLFPNFEALGWSGDNVPPQDMGVDQADAVREYVRRGGHLIISLPNAGNPWGMGVIGQTELEDLLPCRVQGRVPRRDESVSLEELLPTLSKYSHVKTLIGERRQPEFTIRVFKDLLGGPDGFNVIDNHYEPLIALPDGRVIAIQRHFGFGKVTVIGLDLSDGRLTGLGLPQADAFWNRVLGRRIDTPTPAELAEIDKADRLARTDVNPENALGSGNTIVGVINMEGEAGKGLLLALILFVIYWLVAGPGGFALLKHYGQSRHAWVAFALSAILFTAIAWGGVNLLPKRTEISHLTFLDHIARTLESPRANEPQYQRASTYFSAHVPHYGTTPIGVESTNDQRDVLYSWLPPARASQPFPNVDRYRVDVARSPANFAIPARSTATQMYAHWLGGLDREWGGTLLVDPNYPIRVELDANGNEYQLHGRIINELPGTLRDVTVIWVQNNRITRRRYLTDAGVEQPWQAPTASGAPLNVASMWRMQATPPWAPGQPFDLSELRNATPMIISVKGRYIDPYTRRDLGGIASLSTVSTQDRANYLEMLSIFHQLNPPEYLKTPGTTPETGVSFHRQLGRELDLSHWFNRPCLIIMGFLDNAPNPVPLRINNEGNLPSSKSLTVVRWIYPLPLIEEIAFREVFESRDN